MIRQHIEYLESMIKSLSKDEKNGLDTSSLRLFIKNLKMYEKIQSSGHFEKNDMLTFDEKLNIIKSFLEDTKVFPRIIDVINFANKELDLGFKDQKESRDITIKRVIGRINETPELKEKVKLSVKNIRNEKVHKETNSSKKDSDIAASFMKWADILKNI